MAEKEGLYQRLRQAIVWLKQNKNMLQLDIAEKMGMTSVGLSRGLARCKEKNDEDFVIKFHQATDEIFSLDWLLYGTGEKFTADIKKAEPTTAVPASAPVDTSSVINAALAAQMQTIESLKSEQATLLEAHAREIASMNQQIADKQAIIDLQSDKIKSQADEIDRLQKVIADLRSMSLSADIEEYISNNPFPIGVADKTETTRAQV